MENQLQQRFFEKLLEHYPRKADAVEALMNSMQLGKDAVYRRIKGDTLITPEELSQLALKHRISLDALIYGATDTVFFAYNHFSDPSANFSQYLDSVHHRIVRLTKLPKAQMYYASQEIPVFHYMYFPELITFKLYMWGMTTWGFDFLDNQPFSFDLLEPSALQIMEETLVLYNSLPSTELWSLNILENTLNQIEYLATVELFKQAEDALLLIDKIAEMVQHMRLMAEVGKKFNPGSKEEDYGAQLDLYHNEMVNTNNTFLVISERGPALYTTFCDPNFLSSMDQRLCDYTEDWFKRIIGKSNLISRHSARNRSWFFNRLEKKLKDTTLRLRLLFEQE